MQIRPIDQEGNLFHVNEIVNHDLLHTILDTDWLNLPWHRQEGQESWARRKIDNNSLPWLSKWDALVCSLWSTIANHVGFDLEPYAGTAWWLDEPGFTCSLHTDGEMPGSLHATWISAHSDLGTSFFWYKNPQALRHRFLSQPNCGYIMINMPDLNNYRKLLWHGMLVPVPENSFRLTSYTWLRPKSKYK